MNAPIGEQGTAWASGTRVPVVRDALGQVWQEVRDDSVVNNRMVRTWLWREVGSPAMRDSFEGLVVTP